MNGVLTLKTFTFYKKKRRRRNKALYHTKKFLIIWYTISRYSEEALSRCWSITLHGHLLIHNNIPVLPVGYISFQKMSESLAFQQGISKSVSCPKLIKAFHEHAVLSPCSQDFIPLRNWYLHMSIERDAKFLNLFGVPIWVLSSLILTTSSSPALTCSFWP